MTRSEVELELAEISKWASAPGLDRSIRLFVEPEKLARFDELTRQLAAMPCPGGYACTCIDRTICGRPAVRVEWLTWEARREREAQELAMRMERKR